MSQGLKPCPGCGNQHPEIASGNRVICDECGESASYENWQKRRADSPFEHEGEDEPEERELPEWSGPWDGDDGGRFISTEGS